MNQMRTVFVVLVTLLAGVLSGAPQKSDQGDVLLQKAIHKEMVEGNLEEAIKIYKEVFTTNKDNRALAAKALVQMGQCYEKLGNAEARNAYEQVIKEFGDQEEQVQTARTKLAALTARGKAALHQDPCADQIAVFYRHCAIPGRAAARLRRRRQLMAPAGPRPVAPGDCRASTENHRTHTNVDADG